MESSRWRRLFSILSVLLFLWLDLKWQVLHPEKELVPGRIYTLSYPKVLYLTNATPSAGSITAHLLG